MGAAPPLDDRAGAAARAQTRGALAAHWRDQPEFASLKARLAELGPTPDRAALLAAARPLIDETDWLGSMIADAIQASMSDPWFEVPLRPLDPGRRAGFLLFEQGDLRLLAYAVPLERTAAHKRAAAGERSIGFAGTATLIRVLRPGGAVLRLYEADAANDGFTAEAAGRARVKGELPLVEGQIIELDGARTAWTIARQTGDLVLLQALASDPAAPLAVEYDAAGGGYVSASATDGAVARMQLMATLLRLMRRADAGEALADCARDGPFFLRWYMARTLAALDPARAVPLLRAMAAEDAHAEVRAAAAATLELLAA